MKNREDYRRIIGELRDGLRKRRVLRNTDECGKEGVNEKSEFYMVFYKNW